MHHEDTDTGLVRGDLLHACRGRLRFLAGRLSHGALDPRPRGALDVAVDVLAAAALQADDIAVLVLSQPLVVVGGIVPAEDLHRLTGLGVAAVFHPGAKLPAIAAFFRGLPRKAAEAER